jgi:hypothetical protein
VLAIVGVLVLAGSACTETVPDGRATVAADPAEVRARLDEVYQATRGGTGRFTLVDELLDVTVEGAFQHDPVAYSAVVEVDGAAGGEGVLFADRGYTRQGDGSWLQSGRSVTSAVGAGAVPAEILRFLVATEAAALPIEPGEQSNFEGYRWQLEANQLGLPEYEDVATTVDLEVDQDGRVARVVFRVEPLSTLDGAVGHVDHEHDVDLAGGSMTHHFVYEEISPLVPPI